MTLEEMRPGSCSIAVPVRLPGGGIAGLGLVLLSTQSANLRKHLPALLGVAGRIEEAAARPGGGGLGAEAAPALRVDFRLTEVARCGCL